jgi:hypothetical protein
MAVGELLSQGIRLPLFVFSTQSLEEVPHGLGALQTYGVVAAYTPPLNDKSLVNRMIVLLDRQHKMDDLYTEVCVQGGGEGWGMGGGWMGGGGGAMRGVPALSAGCAPRALQRTEGCWDGCVYACLPRMGRGHTTCCAAVLYSYPCLVAALPTPPVFMLTLNNQPPGHAQVVHGTRAVVPTSIGVVVPGAIVAPPPPAADAAHDGSPLRSREIAHGVVVALPSKTLVRPRRSTSGRLLVEPSPTRQRRPLSPVEDKPAEGGDSVLGAGAGGSVMLSVVGALDSSPEGDSVVKAVRAASKMQKRVRVLLAACGQWVCTGLGVGWVLLGLPLCG